MGDADLFKLATRPRHQWGPQRHVEAFESPSRHEQFEWTCGVCGLVRITVIPKGADPRREYRRGESAPQFTAERDPDCAPQPSEQG